MGPQGEVDAKSRVENPKESPGPAPEGAAGAANVESTRVQPEPWSDEDAERPARIAQAIGETETFLSGFRVQGDGYSDTDAKQYQRLSEDAKERAGWSTTRQDAFASLIRMAVPTPPRGKRIL